MEILTLKRKALGLTQQKLAELAEISLPTVQNIESGKANPCWNVLRKISHALGLVIEIKSAESDWDLLAQLGVPLTVQNERTYFQPTKKILLLELKKFLNALDFFHTDRQTEAVSATLLALKTHWPSVYKNLGNLAPKADQLIKKQNSDRMIKFRRIAIEALQRYL